MWQYQAGQRALVALTLVVIGYLAFSATRAATTSAACDATVALVGVAEQTTTLTPFPTVGFPTPPPPSSLPVPPSASTATPTATRSPTQESLLYLPLLQR
jgi:hypothetical protein